MTWGYVYIQNRGVTYHTYVQTYCMYQVLRPTPPGPITMQVIRLTRVPRHDRSHSRLLIPPLAPALHLKNLSFSSVSPAQSILGSIPTNTQNVLLKSCFRHRISRLKRR